MPVDTIITLPLITRSASSPAREQAVRSCVPPQTEKKTRAVQ